MKLTFKLMKIHNFFSFKDDEIDFSANRRMTLVCGKNNDVKDSANGSGKSAMFCALLYGLFGELQNKIKNENIRNRYADTKDMSVDIDFSVEDTEYHVSRGMNKYGQSFVFLYRKDDGKFVDITRSSISETNAHIEGEVLKCDSSIFLRTIFLSSDQNYNFFRLKPQPKKEFIEKLFNISIFGDMYNLIHKDILQSDKTMYSMQNNLLTLNNAEKNYKERMDRFDAEKSKSIELLEKKLEDSNREYNELKKTNVKINEDEVKKYEDALNKLNDGVIKLKDLIKGVQQKISKATKSKIKLESTKEAKKYTVDQYSGLLEKLCEKCSPIVSDHYDLPKYMKEMADIEKKVEELDKQLSELSNENGKYSEKIKLIEDKIQQIEAKLEELTSESTQLKLKLSQYEGHILSLRKDYDRTVNSVNPYKDLYEKNHQEIESNSKDLENVSNRYNYLKYAETIVSQDTLKKFIIKDLVHLLNVKIKHYLSRLGSNYTCVFDENMDYEFITEGGTCEYDNFSSGERMRLMLAASFAFKDFMSTRSNITSNILVLDEFIDSNVDTVAIENIMKILQGFSVMYNQSVYVISHRKEIDNSIFDSIIQVVKTDNISRITYLPNEKS